MTPAMLAFYALVAIIALTALIVSVCALLDVRECRRTNADLYDKLRNCNAACNRQLQDIASGIGRIEGWIEAVDLRKVRRLMSLAQPHKDAES